MSSGVFNFNFLALVLSEILGGPALSEGPLSEKKLTLAQVLTYIYIIVNFELRSSTDAGLTERCVYNKFCIERSAKMGFWGIFFGRGGAKIFGGNPLGMY